MHDVMVIDPDCELCEAAGLTERYYDDEVCWVAECESCFVPMIVLRDHVVDPPADVKVLLHDRLSVVVAAEFEGAFWIDENMRSIPTHYHAHARPTHGFGASGFRRRSTNGPTPDSRTPT